MTKNNKRKNKREWLVQNVFQPPCGLFFASEASKVGFWLTYFFLACSWLPFPSIAFPLCTCGERARPLVSLPLLIRTQSYWIRAHPYDHLTLITPLHALSPNTVILGIRVSTYIFRGTQFSPKQQYH